LTWLNTPPARGSVQASRLALMVPLSGLLLPAAAVIVAACGQGQICADLARPVWPITLSGVGCQWLVRALQIQAQQVKEPAHVRADRADDDRAASGREAGSDGQRPCSGAVNERQPGQVEDQPLGLVIDGDGCLGQEPASLETV
jgi:hypothetical protein